METKNIGSTKTTHSVYSIALKTTLIAFRPKLIFIDLFGLEYLATAEAT